MSEFYAGNSAFREAARAAEETALGEGGLDTVLVEPETPEPQEVIEETPVVEAEAPETEEVRLLAGKYRSVEDLERAHSEAQAIIDRQGNELGELRRSFEDRFSQLEQRANTRQITPDLISDDPAAATQIAFEQQDQYTMARAFEAWREEDPFAAAAWAITKQTEQREAALRAEIEQVKQQVTQTQSAVQPQQDIAVWHEAWALAEKSVPDIRANAQVILDEVAPQFADVFAGALTAGDAAARAKALVALAGIARGRNADTLNEAVTQAARETAEEAQKARTDAYVASQDTGSAQEPLSWEEQEKQRAREMFTSKQTSWEQNWTGRAPG